MIIKDLAEDPQFNPATQNNRGTWSMYDVSEGTVTLGADGKPSCRDHRAMNAVNPDRTIWRCLACGRACFAEWKTK